MEILLRIAIVEDRKKMTKALQEYLGRFGKEQQCDIQSSVFSDDMQIAERYRPTWDFILLDIEIPLLDSASGAERIRQIDGNVTLIFITNMAPI